MSSLNINKVTRERHTKDAIFNLDTLIDKFDKTGVEGKKLFVAFIDFQKAYDFVYCDVFFSSYCEVE